MQSYDLSSHAFFEARKTVEHVRTIVHLIHWMHRRKITFPILNDEHIECFVQCLSRCKRPAYTHDYLIQMGCAARRFLSDLRAIGEVHTVPTPLKSDPWLLVDFQAWMRQQRGVSDASLQTYSVPLRQMLQVLGSDPTRYNARNIRQFVFKSTRGAQYAVTKRCVTVVRMFLRFLIVQQRCRASLLAALPLMAQWRQASLPRYLSPEDIERLICSFDPLTALGQRNRAILLLLACLGLRAGDIVVLQLSDID